MITDTVADMFARIRNANLKLHEKVDIPMSKLKVEIAKILKDEGYVLNFRVVEDGKQGTLRISLKYTSNGEQVIKGIRKISKSSLRIYRSCENIPKTIGGLGVTIVSTSRGLMTDEQAKVAGVGGEVLGCIW